MYVSKYFKNANMREVSLQDIKKYRDWLRKQPSVKGAH